jgi:hypothetical protein
MLGTATLFSSSTTEIILSRSMLRELLLPPRRRP